MSRVAVTFAREQIALLRRLAMRRPLVRGSSATRVLVSREVAEALMPRPCPHVDCEGEGDTHCWGCHGSGSLPPVLRLLVVEGYWPPGFVTDEDHPPAPRYDVARAIEAGERIRIEVEPEDALCPGCKACGPHCAIPRRVPVGSVRPVRVLPVREGLASHIDTPVGQWLSVWRRDLRLDPPGYEWVAAIQSCDGHHIRTRPIDAAPLGVYGPAESLIGQFAVEVEDARREP